LGIWKDIEGYQGKYKISNLNRVINNDNGKELKLFINSGYHAVTLSFNGSRKNLYMHRLLAKHFIDNPNDYPMINHKDECRLNNSIDNLEWCTAKYNQNYNGINHRRSNSRYRDINFNTGDISFLNDIYLDNQY
jgi:hypothetical protein